MNILFYISILFTLILLLLNYRRRCSEEDKGIFFWLTFLYRGILVFVFSLCFSAIFLGVISAINTPIYTAKVVSQIGISDEKSTNIQIEFKDRNNQLITKTLKYNRDAPPKIGKTIKITYKEGDDVKTLQTARITIGIFSVFALILGIAWLFTVLYSLGQDYSFITKILVILTLFIVVPAAILIFIGILGWILWEYYEGRKDLPQIAIGLCSIFITVLILAFLGYFKLLFGNKEGMISDLERQISGKLDPF
ncbi:hypothetical protein [Chryseobacterium sp.]|mgnify:CR=1 FL=1|uniref:hypothetical protein n=1 Tax=Chryseobacterium sp. TaxID=1871047 RepID=UPI0025BC4A80|nr:hypothetical protein [Chryseobacterium sp.]